MRTLISIFTLFLAIIPALPLSQGQLLHEKKNIMIDSLRRELTMTNTYRDSLFILHTITDLASGEERAEVYEEIFNSAIYNSEDSIALTSLISLANIYRDDLDRLNEYSGRLDRFAPSNIKSEADLFLNILKSDIIITNDTISPHSLEFAEQFNQYQQNTPEDPFVKAREFYDLCLKLGHFTEGTFLEDFYEQLEDQIEGLPLNSGNVRNLIYNRTAPVFSNNYNPSRAIETDRKYLNVLDSMEHVFHAHGRVYRTYALPKARIYTRMLQNASALNANEIEYFYRSILKLADEYPNVNSDIQDEEAFIYYSLATGNYSGAVDALKRQLPNIKDKTKKNLYLNALVDAASAVGDHHTQLQAAMEANKLMRQHLQDVSTERSRELHTLYHLEELRDEDSAMQLQQHIDTLRTNRIVLWIGVVILLILLVLLSGVIHRNRRIKAMTQTIRDGADRLRLERNELKKTHDELIVARDQAKNADRLKTEFINLMSHEVKTPLAAINEYSRLIIDCIPESKSRYLDRFADIIEANTQLVMTLVNDVLDVASLEQKQMSLDPKPTSVYSICNLAMDDVFDKPSRQRPEVAVIFNPADKPDQKITTDMKRVAQILINLLDNASKFTERGSIILDFDYLESCNSMVFTVTDTGTGIPRKKENFIFQRFTKLDSSKSGCGLGLYISRQLAELLGGTLEIDPKYRNGARFVLTIPV